MNFKSGLINNCIQSSPITLYLYVSQELKQLFCFSGNLNIVRKLFLI